MVRQFISLSENDRYNRVDCWNKTLNNCMPTDVSYGSKQKYWFVCKACNHTFIISLMSVSKGQWCHYCSNHKLCDNLDCLTCYNKSFVSTDKAKYWSFLNLLLNPRFVFKSSVCKGWFNCFKCNHVFTQSLSEITHRSGWCSYCSNNQLCSNSECVPCYKKSFASSDRAQYWNIALNIVLPRSVFLCSHSMYWFTCQTCNNNFELPLNNVTCQRRWCPLCYHKTELKLFEFLRSIYPLTRRRQKFDWCKNKTHLVFDFYIEELGILIELDGQQHFTQVWNWNSPEMNFISDIFKEVCAHNNGLSMIRLLQEEVWDDSHTWREELRQGIQLVIDNPHQQYNIYIHKTSDVYKKFVDFEHEGEYDTSNFAVFVEHCATLNILL